MFHLYNPWKRQKLLEHYAEMVIVSKTNQRKHIGSKYINTKGAQFRTHSNIHDGTFCES